MEKKYIDKRQVRSKICQELLEGKAKSEILAELENLYYDKDQLTKLVINTPQPRNKKKYKFQNLLLGILGVALVLFRFWSFRADYAGSGLSIVTLIMAISVFSYEAISYRLIAIVSIITCLKYISNYDSHGFIIIDLIMTVVIVGLGFHLGSKLFPKYGILGPKKDSNGNVVVD
ncbi:MAG TPA: hypothetical protein VD927_05875 [Chryseosolibacter sp.]|nr:hypothetical protein [Chryseosolibacter sp.]